MPDLVNIDVPQENQAPVLQAASISVYVGMVHAYECRLRMINLPKNKPAERCQYPECDKFKEKIEHSMVCVGGPYCTYKDCAPSLYRIVLHHWENCKKKTTVCRLCKPAAEEWKTWVDCLKSD